MSTRLLVNRVCSHVTMRKAAASTKALTGMIRVQNNRDNFTVSLELRGFNKEDLKAYVGGDHLNVELKCDDVPKPLSERFKLPDNAIRDSLQLDHSPTDGVFTIKLAKQMLPENYWEIPFADNAK